MLKLNKEQIELIVQTLENEIESNREWIKCNKMDIEELNNWKDTIKEEENIIGVLNGY